MDLTLGYALILVGFLLLVLELFVPSGGVLGVLSLVALAVGVTFTFRYSVQVGTITLVAVFVAVPIVVCVLLPYWTRSPIGKQLVMETPDAASGAAVSTAATLEKLRGRVGKTLSSLRPAGVVDFEGQRVDALTEGMMVDAAQWVKCVDIKAGKVIVRPVEAPPAPTRLENADFS
jgi:membrane-bound serine protease (ClpP class)